MLIYLLLIINSSFCCTLIIVGANEGLRFKRQSASTARTAELANGTNRVMNASLRRQAAAGGSKKTKLLAELDKVEADVNDALHGLLTKLDDGRWSLINGGGGPKNLEPGKPWRILTLRLGFKDGTFFKYWFTSASKKYCLGPQEYKWSTDRKSVV